MDVPFVDELVPGWRVGGRDLHACGLDERRPEEDGGAGGVVYLEVFGDEYPG